MSTPRSAGIPIQSSDPSSAFRSDFCKDFYNGPDEFGDTAPGTSDPDRYYTGLHAHSDILMSKASNQKTKSGKKALNPKKSSTVSSKGIQKAVVIANNRTEKQSRHIPREHEMAAFSPGKSMEESVLLGIPISEKHLSVEAKKIEQQIAGKDIIDLIDLTRLGLTMITYLLSHLSKKKTILTVDLSHNSIKQIPDCFQLDIIQRFHARYNAIRSVCIKGSMNALLELDLNSNEITEFPSVDALEKMPSLKTLILYGNKIKTLPEDSIMYLAEIGLKDLNLSFNELSELPVQICEMTSLRVLRLSNNYIKRLPRDIVQLQLIGPNAFDITGNQLVYPPQDVAKLGMNNIRSYFSLENESSIRFNQFKLIVVGHESAGKTSIITYLMTYNVNTEALPSPVGSRGDASFPPPWNRAHSDENIMGGIPLAGPSLRSVGRTRSGMSSISDASSTKPAGRTVGLEISTLHLSIPNQQISGTPRVAQGSRIDAEVVDDDIVYLSIWDFAGQEVYHSAHEVICW